MKKKMLLALPWSLHIGSLSKSVRNRHIDLIEQLFYVLDKDNMYTVPLNRVINKINANKRIIIVSKLLISQILRHC